MLNWISTERYLKIIWFLRYGTKLNLENPRTYNEKIQWMKVYDHNEFYNEVVDKINVKNYIRTQLGEKYIIPTLWVGDRPEDIPYEKFPNQFVIKCAHGSHCSIIVKNKNNIKKNKINKKLKKWLKKNWYWYAREWAYKDVKPRIIVEQYMEDKIQKELIDYKFYCFDGEPFIVDVCSKRYSGGELNETYFDTKWKLLNIHSGNHPIDKNITKPKKFEEMLKIAKKLSKTFHSVRVDLYEINGDVYFGELTFYSAAGFENFQPEEWAIKLGSMMNIS